jgi:YVTN family beta-propeller protein
MRILALTLVAAGALASIAVGAAQAPTVIAKIKVGIGTAPCAAFGGAGAVWVSEYGSPYLLKINPHTNKVVKKIGIGSGSCGLGFGAGSLWIEDTSSSTISRVSASTGKRTAAITVGIQPYDATYAFGAVWATSNGIGDVERIDPTHNKVVKRYPLATATGIVGAFNSVWAAGQDGVIRIDPATDRVVATISIEGGAGWTAASDNAVWVTTTTGIARIDPATNTVAATIPLGTPALGDPAVVAGKLWVPKIRANVIAVIDPATNAVSATVKAGIGPFVVTEIAGEAWIPSWKGRDIWRIKP